MILLSAQRVYLLVQQDDGKCSSLKSTRIVSQKSRSWSPSDSLRKTSCSSPRSRWSRIKVDSRKTWSPPDNFTFPSPIGKMIFTNFRRYHFICIESPSMDFWRLHLLQLLKVCDKVSSDDIQSSNQMELQSFKMVRRIAVREVSSRPTRGLERFADGSNIPWNQPTIFRPSLTATRLHAPLFQQCHLSLNGEVLTYNDSKISLHKLWQILGNCQYKRLSAWLSVSRTSVSSFLSLDNFLHGYDLNSLSCQILYHDCIPVIVSRFTFFT